ncbi:glutathione S-transferase theta-1-like [Lingula anatina]|uniref:Glutathione S-transferase theta-1-like n=1 Tax=Lingula anatina TaxID=7574 RepID=A0A1S3HZZ6_LINAN|nr:glutathione S-transferase theta-1-like [Lingula anatina]|eukprot:XP_013391146.1 glutathione S-transferase theta-1-like [Lingula anatina]
MATLKKQAILRYLATTYTNFAGYGNTARERALCESIISWASSELHRVVGYYYTYPQFLDRFRLPSDSANEALIEAGIKGMTKHLETLEKRYLQKSPYLVGDEITVADTVVATILCQAEWVGFKFKIWPRVNQWLDNVKQQEFWDRVHDAHYQFLRELEQEVPQFD